MFSWLTDQVGAAAAGQSQHELEIFLFRVSLQP
jgi:hypothetical protein